MGRHEGVEGEAALTELAGANKLKYDEANDLVVFRLNTTRPMVNSLFNAIMGVESTCYHTCTWCGHGMLRMYPSSSGTTTMPSSPFPPSTDSPQRGDVEGCRL